MSRRVRVVVVVSRRRVGTATGRRVTMAAQTPRVQTQRRLTVSQLVTVRASRALMPHHLLLLLVLKKKMMMV